jgi:hypothetical protein
MATVGAPSSDFNRFVAAVKCLTSGENIQAANEWLMQFKGLDAAWGVTVQCLAQAALAGVDAEDLENIHFQAASTCVACGAVVVAPVCLPSASVRFFMFAAPRHGGFAL